MSLSSPFIQRPVATTLLTAAIALAGGVAFSVLPVSPLPQIDFPTISVAASLPGGSPAIMASSVATPLEREFGSNVMTALQAIVWHALRSVGVNDRIEGYGRLFREF